MRVIGVKHLLKEGWMHCLEGYHAAQNTPGGGPPRGFCRGVCEERLARVSSQALARIIEETQNRKSREGKGRLREKP